MNIPRTNAVIGDKIIASITVSNAVDQSHAIFINSVDRAGCGFGYFSIVELATHKAIKSRFSPTGFGSFRPLAGRTQESFEFDLAYGYTITNAGLYSVSVIGWFQENESATNSQRVSVQTPAIIIEVSPKAATNVSSHLP